MRVLVGAVGAPGTPGRRANSALGLGQGLGHAARRHVAGSDVFQPDLHLPRRVLVLGQFGDRLPQVVDLFGRESTRARIEPEGGHDHVVARHFILLADRRRAVLLQGRFRQGLGREAGRQVDAVLQLADVRFGEQQRSLALVGLRSAGMAGRAVVVRRFHAAKQVRQPLEEAVGLERDRGRCLVELADLRVGDLDRDAEGLVQVQRRAEFHARRGLRMELRPSGSLSSASAGP